MQKMVGYGAQDALRRLRPGSIIKEDEAVL
jgi:hypothetical protein